MQLKKCNSFVEVEAFVATLEPDKFITVWSNCGFLYVEDGAVYNDSWDNIYRGVAYCFSSIEEQFL
jgi:hypothetical protein